MKTITIEVPDEIEPFADDLQYFVGTMVRKLFTNRHRGTDNLDPDMMIGGAIEELQETRKALAEEGQFATFVEFADVANYAFLGARGALYMTRAQFDKLYKGKT